jgi:hypothetical protein
MSYAYFDSTWLKVTDGLPGSYDANATERSQREFIIFNQQIVTILLHYLLLVPATSADQSSRSNIFFRNDSVDDCSSSNKTIEGVTVTVIFRAPKWFHLSYKGSIYVTK